jgi:hypothetical protein
MNVMGAQSSADAATSAALRRGADARDEVDIGTLPIGVSSERQARR